MQRCGHRSFCGQPVIWIAKLLGRLTLIGNFQVQIVIANSKSLSRRKEAVRWLSASLCLCALLGTVACGGSSSPPASPVSGNWQMQLVGPNSDQPWQLSGFLLQSGNSVTGSFISVPNVTTGFGCNGVGPVSGTLNSQNNLKLDVNESGQDVSLTASFPSEAPSSKAPLTGQFSTLAAGCTSTSTGTWSAVPVTPIAGSFHGTFTPPPVTGEAPVDVTGTLNQGPNVGDSNATLTGTINATGPTRFCSYLNSATITGLISGAQVTLDFLGPDGSQIGHLGSPPATITPDAKSLTCSSPCSYTFTQISKSCTGDSGTVELTFP